MSKRIEAKRNKTGVLILVMLTFLAAPSRAADDVSLLKDLTAVIALLRLAMWSGRQGHAAQGQ